MTFGPIKIGPITFSLYWMLLGLTLSVLGLHGFYVGCIVRTFFDYGGANTRRWLRMFSYTRSVLFSGLATLLGVGLTIPLVRQYFHSGLRLPAAVLPASRYAITGLLFIIGGAMNFTFTLALHAAAANVKRK